MESSTKHKSPKNLLNKIFHPNSSKKSSVSPSSSPPERTPSLFPTMDDDSRWSTASPVHHITDYSNSIIHNYRMNVTPSDSREARSSAPSAAPIQRSNSVQRRCSLSNMHDNRQRLIAAKRAEYQAKMDDAFDDLIRKRRGSTLRIALASDA